MMWDPGKDLNINANMNTKYAMWQCILSSTEYENGTNLKMNSRTDLDSHVNMVVLGRTSCIVNYTGKIAQVRPFIPDHEALNLHIVDTVI